MQQTPIVLILGATGMLGHKLFQRLGEHFIVFGTVRDSASQYADHPVLQTSQLVDHVTVEDFNSIVRAMALIRPTVVINCIGIIKQSAAAKDPLPSILVNALFPHRLAQLCTATNSRLIHISTDCVFSGKDGNYSEASTPDAVDLYGRTKLLGEVITGNTLTIRTSIVGRELNSAYGLFEWFFSQVNREIQGYKKALFSGLTTLALADILIEIITHFPDLLGLWHIASDPISKYELLSIANDFFGLSVRIIPDEDVVIDRTLNDLRFRMTTGIPKQSWSHQLAQMLHDATPYCSTTINR